MFNDFLRHQSMLPADGPDIQAAPTPLMPPLQFNTSGAGAPGLSSGSISALSGLGTALGGMLDKRNAAKRSGGMTDSPMMKKPFPAIGPPMETV